VETDRRLQAIITKLENAGIRLEEAAEPADEFDASKLSKMVD
jgi:serine O-acetyltransferase